MRLISPFELLLQVMEEMERDAERAHAEIGDLSAALVEANAALANANAAVAAATEEHEARAHELVAKHAGEIDTLREQMTAGVAEAVRDADAKHAIVVADLNKEVRVVASSYAICMGDFALRSTWGMC